MEYTLHRADERGIAEHGWLHSRFSFSFAEYHNPKRMGFGTVRVINDDVVDPESGFGMHPHRDMEIITIMLKGALEHKDSIGNHDIITAGEIQYMCAGSGIEHSEFNPSKNEAAELFQIWIRPDIHGRLPRYEKRDFRTLESANRWGLVVSSDGREGSMLIHQDAFVSISQLDKGKSLTTESMRRGHGRLLIVMEGSVEAGGYTLNRRDELQIIGDESFSIIARESTHLLLFDVAMR